MEYDPDQCGCRDENHRMHLLHFRHPPRQDQDHDSQHKAPVIDDCGLPFFNTVYLEEVDEINGDITILANPFLMDFDRPLTVVTVEDEFSTDLNPDSGIIAGSIRETGDIFLCWADEVRVSFGQ